jgi:hypothetical protein
MKKKLLLILAFCVTGILSYGQDRVIVNFDDVKYGTNAWGGTGSKTINPNKDAVNSSDSVGLFVVTEGWGAIAMQNLSPNFDLINLPVLNVKVYCTKAGTVTVNIQEADYLSGGSAKATIAAGDVKKWVQLSFDFSKYPSRYGYREIQINYNQTASDSIFIDDVVFTAPTGPVTNAPLFKETFYAKWSEWGDWTGVANTQAGKWYGRERVSATNITLSRQWDDYAHVLSMTKTSQAFTLDSIPITGYDNLILYYDINWREAGASSASRPTIEAKIDQGSWFAVTTAQNESQWPTTNGQWGTITVPLTPTLSGDSISFRISAASLDYWVDNLLLTGIGKATRIHNSLQGKEISFYPNPVKNILNISSESNIVSIKIISTSGKLLKLVHNLKSVDVSDLPTGVYLIKVQSDKAITTSKFIKK